MYRYYTVVVAKMGVFFVTRVRADTVLWCSGVSVIITQTAGVGQQAGLLFARFRDMKYISNRFLHPLGLHKLYMRWATVHVYKKRAFTYFFPASCVDMSKRKKKTKKDYR